MTFHALLAASALLLVAAMTPGPNNLVVLRTAAVSPAALWSAMGGIVLGGVAMLALVVTAGSMLGDLPLLRTAVAAAGASYLGWLGLTMLRSPAAARDQGAPLPAGFTGLFAFQFFNPKSWVMVLSLVASFPQQDAATILAWLAPLFLAIPSACLLLWALAGRHLAPRLQAPATRRSFDRIMGLALLASAVLLLL